MLYREIMAVCSEIHTKHINAPCGQNVELLNVKLAVHIVTTVRYIYRPLGCRVSVNCKQQETLYKTHTDVASCSFYRVTNSCTIFCQCVC